MERSANYAMIGIATTVLLLVGLAFAVWLGGSRGHGTDRYRVVFHGPVTGLSQGSQVQFNGIKVGEVERVGFVPQDASLILVDIKIQKGTPVRTDSVATTAMQGISGVSAIAISAGTVSKPLLRGKDPSGEDPIIVGKTSGLASLVQTGEKVAAGANEAIGRVNRLLSDRTIAQLATTASNLHDFSAELAAHRGLVGDAATTMARLNRAADEIERASTSARSLIDGDGRKTMANVSAAAVDLRQTLRDARGAIGKIDATAADVGPNLDATLVTLQRVGANLDDLLRNLRTDPHATLGKPRGKELEIPK